MQSATRQPARFQRNAWLLPGNVILSLAIFLLDFVTPVGFSVWPLYLIPLILTMRSPERRFRPLMAAFCTVLVVAGFFFPSPETYEFAAIFRRAIAVSMLWLTLLLLQRMQTEEAVRDLVDLLTGRDVTEREQARAMLQRLKSDHRTRTIPIVVLTSSREETDLLRAYETGTNSFIVKPVDFDSFMEAVRQLGLYWLLVNQFPAGNGVPSGS